MYSTSHHGTCQHPQVFHVNSPHTVCLQHTQIDTHWGAHGHMNLQPLFLTHSCSLSLSLCLPAARQQYLLLGISFVLIIRINDWFGYLNASFRETSLLCHCYKLLARFCFTWGCSSTLPCTYIYIHNFCFIISLNYTELRCLCFSNESSYEIKHIN